MRTGAGVRVRERFEDATLLAFDMEEGAKEESGL